MTERALRSVLIANPKGGAGKSTLATNVAGHWATQGARVMLGDIDPQQSARHWLGMRSPLLAPSARISGVGRTLEHMLLVLLLLLADAAGAGDAVADGRSS